MSGRFFLRQLDVRARRDKGGGKINSTCQTQMQKMRSIARISALFYSLRNQDLINKNTKCDFEEISEMNKGV